MDTAFLLWGVFFSSLGLGFFIYGKKQNAIVPLLTGMMLLVFPYFISDVYLLVLTGTALVTVPYFIRL